jgi:hypothetical protein
VDDNLKTKRRDFWKYVSKFKKNDVFTQIKIGENVITQPHCIVEAFGHHFSSIFDSPSSVVIQIHVYFTFSDFLNFPLISCSDVKQAFRRLT